MKVHNLKIQYIYAKTIVEGTKTFELRKDDRNFKEGDYIAFEILDPSPPIPKQTYEGAYSFRVKEEINSHIYKITYKLSDVSEYGLDPGCCILAIKPVRLENHPNILMREEK